MELWGTFLHLLYITLRIISGFSPGKPSDAATERHGGIPKMRGDQRGILLYEERHCLSK